jgi:nucleoside-diphosphate-sugar epimerase
MKTDVADEAAVSNAFSQKWPQAVADLPLTVFHLAAVIRPAERLKEFRHLSSNVNVDGTKNVLNAAKKTGASCLITTSSGSVGIHRPTFWIFPWTRRPTRLLQVLDDMAKTPKEHNEFFGNYAASKMEAEIIVRNADDPQSNFRTGCIRPTNGIYGIGRDTSPTVIALYLSKGGSVS